MVAAATRISPLTLRMRDNRAIAGFTLVEMTATMAIIALVASLAIATTPGTGRAGLKAVTMDAVALLRHEREGAILTGADRQVILDGPHRRLMGQGGGAVAVPSDVAINLLGVADPSAGRVPVALFTPDGASSGAVLRLSREAAVYEIRVNWYTGGVSVKAD
jgi:general secretion pathway protein H